MCGERCWFCGAPPQISLCVGNTAIYLFHQHKVPQGFKKSFYQKRRRKKEGKKSGRIQRCKWWITFHQVKGNIFWNNTEMEQETLTSCFIAANIFIQEDNHEITQKMGLSWTGPWKSWYTVITAWEKSLQPHIITRKRREAGCVHGGTGRNRRGGGDWFNETTIFSPPTSTVTTCTCISKRHTKYKLCFEMIKTWFFHVTK